MDTPTVVRAGTCLSEAPAWTTVREELHGLLGWQQEFRRPVQQQHDAVAFGIVAAHAGCGVHNPMAKKAMRVATALLKVKGTEL